VARLLRIAKIIAPDRDWTWLREQQQDTRTAAQPRSNFGRLTTTGQLVEAGLILSEEAALRRGVSDRKRACIARNGVMIALMGLCPIRLRNFSSLELGLSFKLDNGQWWIELDALHTKGRRSDLRAVHEFVEGRPKSI
jgi:hypothetical protein